MRFCKSLIFNEIYGGERGIRTRGTSSETPAMKAHLKKKWHQSGKSGKKRQIKHFPKRRYYTKINPSFYTRKVDRSSAVACPSFVLAFA
jgi:hypothetical protein